MCARRERAHARARAQREENKTAMTEKLARATAAGRGKENIAAVAADTPRHLLLTSSLSQRLHQPHRPLQPPQHVHHPRGRRPRLPDAALPDQRLLGAADPEPAPACVERQEVSCKLRGGQKQEGGRHGSLFPVGMLKRRWLTAVLFSAAQNPRQRAPARRHRDLPET
jgi:hypothetical protein